MTGGSKPTSAGRDDQTTRVGFDSEPIDTAERELTFPERYAVLDELGRGGMGTVYRAYDKTLSREVAIKRLHGHLVGQEARLRLAREARAMAQLNHRNVVSVFDVTEIDDDPMVVMEYVAGGTLGQWLKRGDPTPDEVLARFLEAGRGLAAAHAAGIVHHDFKPGNVLIDHEGTAKVTDFGLAKPQDSEFEGDPTTGPFEPGSSWSSRVTDGNVVMGTPHYMAPEQHTGAASSPASDQYSFCVALTEALRAQPLFRGSDARALYTAKRVVSTTLEERGLPKRLVAPLKRGLAGRPEERFEDMEGLLAELEPPKPASKRWIVGAAVAIALAGGVAVGSMARDDATPAPAPCSTSTALIEEVWSDARRTAVAQALGSAQGDWVETTGQYVLASFDAFSEDWANAHRDACEATEVRQEQSDRAMDVRMSCLREAKTQFAVTLDSIESLGEDAAKNGPRLVAGLPTLSRCADAEAIDAAFPEDPETGERVGEIRDRLAEVAALDDAGEFEAANQAVEALLLEAQAIGFAPLIAECLHKKAVVSTTRDPERAMVLNYQALELALDSGHQTLGVIILMGLSFAETQLGETHTGERLGRIAAALAPPDSTARGMAIANQGAALLEAKAKNDEAVVLMLQSKAILERQWGPDDPRLAVAVMNIGVAEERRGHYRASYRHFVRAQELASQGYGDNHPLVLQIRMAEANAISNLGAPGASLSVRLALRDPVHATFGHPSRASMNFELQFASTLYAARRFDDAEAILSDVIAFDEDGSARLKTPASLLLAMLRAHRGDGDVEPALREVLGRCESTPCYQRNVTWARVLLFLAEGKPSHATVEGEQWLADRPRNAGCWGGEAEIFIESLDRADDPRSGIAWRTWLECSRNDRAALLAHRQMLKTSR